MPLSTRVTFNTGGVRDACVDHVARQEKANARTIAAQNEAANAVNATTATAAIGGRRRFINVDNNTNINRRSAAARPRVRPLPSSASLVDHTPLERRNRNNAALAGLTDAQWHAYVQKERAHLQNVEQAQPQHQHHAHAPPSHLLNSGLGRANDAVEKLDVQTLPRKKTIMTPRELRDDTQLALSGSIDTEAASVLAQNAIYEAKWDRDQVLRHHQHDAAIHPTSAASEAASRTVQSQTTPSLAVARARARGPVERSTSSWREAQRQLADFTDTMSRAAKRDAAANVVLHHQHQYHLDPAALTMTAPEIKTARDWSTKALEAAANRDARKMEAELIEQHKRANVEHPVGDAAFRTKETHLEGRAALRALEQERARSKPARYESTAMMGHDVEPDTHLESHAALRALEQELARSKPVQRREVIFNAASMPSSFVNNVTPAPGAMAARRYESTARAMGRDLERSGLMQLGLADKAARATRYESTAMAMGHDVEKSSTSFGKNDAPRATAPSPFNRAHRRSWGAAEAGPLPLPEHVDPSMYVTENRASFRVPFQW